MGNVLTGAWEGASGHNEGSLIMIRVVLLAGQDVVDGSATHVPIQRVNIIFFLATAGMSSIKCHGFVVQIEFLRDEGQVVS